MHVLPASHQIQSEPVSIPWSLRRPRALRSSWNSWGKRGWEARRGKLECRPDRHYYVGPIRWVRWKRYIGRDSLASGRSRCSWSAFVWLGWYYQQHTISRSWYSLEPLWGSCSNSWECLDSLKNPPPDHTKVAKKVEIKFTSKLSP